MFIIISIRTNLKLFFEAEFKRCVCFFVKIEQKQIGKNVHIYKSVLSVLTMDEKYVKL